MDKVEKKIILGRTVEADFNAHQIRILKNDEETGLEDVIGCYSDYPQYCKKTIDEYFENEEFIKLHNKVFDGGCSHSIQSVDDMYEGEYIGIRGKGAEH